MPAAAEIFRWLELNHWDPLVPAIGDATAQTLRERRNQLASDYQVIATPDAETFIVEFWAAVLNQVPVFVTDPQWGSVEKQQFQSLLASHPRPTPGQILIPTGGTSGQLKFAIHSPETLTAATKGFQEFYGVQAINSCCLLPLHHVSGLMQLWRSATTLGQLRFTLEPLPPQKFFLSLVPTQLQRYLLDRADWLRAFRVVMVGGAPLPPDLAIAARAQQIPLSPSYGSTETAGMVAALPVAEFLAGRLSSGWPLPHVDLQIDSEGRIAIDSPSLMAGYWPPSLDQGEPWCDDLGAIDEFGQLRILGRHSQKIISGGEKVFPQEVEAAIWETGLVLDVCVVGWPDADWGERVVALYVPNGSVEIGDLPGAIAGHLSKFKQPKDWLAVTEIPRNGQGKIDRQQINSLVAANLSLWNRWKRL